VLRAACARLADPDMPFGSYQSVRGGERNASKLMQAGRTASSAER